MSGGSLGFFAQKYLPNCFANVWVSRFFKQMSKPHFPWNPCRSQNVPNKRCKPWVLCVRNLCSQIIKWYLIDTQWPLFVYIVSKDRTLPQPFFWRVVGTRIVWLVAVCTFSETMFRIQNVHPSPKERFPTNSLIRVCARSIPSRFHGHIDFFLHELQAGIFTTHMHKNPECPSDTPTVNKSIKHIRALLTRGLENNNASIKDGLRGTASQTVEGNTDNLIFQGYWICRKVTRGWNDCKMILGDPSCPDFIPPLCFPGQHQAWE